MLYIMRHGKTDWNATRKLQGRTDIPLNDEGRQMASAAGEKYRDLPLDLCYTSPLIRARETAELFFAARAENLAGSPSGSGVGAPSCVPIRTDDRLREMSFGVWEGVADSFQIPDCPINALFQHPENYTTPAEDGESFEQLFARTGAFLKDTIAPQLREGKNILIVGHGAMNCALISQIRRLPRKDFWSAGIDNCVLLEFPPEEVLSIPGLLP
jgi:probable phosphoglycerate mutase